MNRRKLSLYKQNDKGLVTVEFVVIAFGLLMMIFFVVEMTTLYFNILSSQMAARQGARVAVVSDPVVPIATTSTGVGLPLTNFITTSAIYGTSCSVANTCTGFTAVSCTGSSCTAAAFNPIYLRMGQFLGGLQAKNVTITYTYAGLGFAGGPTIPLVTVKISGVAYKTVIINALVKLFASTDTGFAGLTTLPSTSVTLMGEDLSSSGGS